MKRIWVICCIVVLSLFLAGCAKTIELTDEENHLIAEYAAELLLKYDRNMEQKYYDDSVEPSKPATPADADKDTGTTEESSTEDVTSEEVTGEVTTEENSGTATNTEDGNSDGTTEDDSLQGITADADKNFDIAEFAGLETVSVKYDCYMVLDRYPSYDQDGVYIEIAAPTGYKLLVVKFNIENKTNQEQYIDLYSKNLDYSIIINDSRSAKQMLTILIDDLYTYQADIDASMIQEAVLLFQVSDSVAGNIEDLKLKVENEDAERVIQLQ